MYNNNYRGKILFFITDILATILSVGILAVMFDYHILRDIIFIFNYTFLAILMNIMLNQYKNRLHRGFFKEFKKVIIYSFQTLAVFAMTLLFGKYNYLEDIGRIRYRFYIIFILVVVFVTYILRCLSKAIAKKYFLESKIAIVLTGFSQPKKLNEFLKNYRYQVAFYISDNAPENTSDLSRPIFRDSTDIREYLSRNVVDEIIVDSDARDSFFRDIKLFGLMGYPVKMRIDQYFKYFSGNGKILKIDDIQFLATDINEVHFRELVMKRFLDIGISLIGLVITGIVALVIMPIVKKQSPGPLIFKQKRVGRNGKIFQIYKFRSMYLDAEERKKDLLEQNNLDTNLMFKMENDPRIFPFGHKLRQWSLDELPQFINVLKGDMSVVGTRPPTLDEYQNYDIHHFKRMFTKPGITGLWQVSGRSDITDFEDVLELDLKYIQNWSIGMDIKIILKTLLVVLKKEGSK